MTGPVIVGLSSSPMRGISKAPQRALSLEAGLGVVGDIHAGPAIRHLARMLKDPNQPNLRQVHFVGAELYSDLRLRGFDISYGDLGENIVLDTLDVSDYSAGVVLHAASGASVEISGLRRPCKAINDLAPGLLPHCLGRTEDGDAFLRHGLMGIVVTSGDVRIGDQFSVRRPEMTSGPLSVV